MEIQDGLGRKQDPNLQIIRVERFGGRAQTVVLCLTSAKT
jgi:hypothetical protein